jgi:hypothetical protein
MPIPQFTAGQVLTAAELNAMVDAINAGGAVKVERFTASGTWTVPAGVTYAKATIIGGGGGVGTASAGTGGTSSVAFAGGTVSATGGTGINSPNANFGSIAGVAYAQPANSGKGALIVSQAGTSANWATSATADGGLIVAGGAVTPAASITVTVGAGGAAGTGTSAAGADGYVYIEYQGG